MTILVLSGTTVFPNLPNLNPKNVAALPNSDTTTPSEIAEVSPDEVCRWQRDFSFFNELLGEKKTNGDVIPCADVAGADGVKTKTEPVIVAQDEMLVNRITELAAGYPIEVMAPTIAEYDKSVAALIVGIAKKESNWGKRVPRSSDGADCFNYWGFKGAGSRGTAMGHGCFGSPEEAVHAVGNRIAELVALRKTSEPKNMIIWKCGSSCATHSPESVQKWIADVDLYYQKIVQN